MKPFTVSIDAFVDNTDILPKDVVIEQKMKTGELYASIIQFLFAFPTAKL